jgi:preprotein translocase subunit SecA
MEEGEAIEHRWVSRAIENAQRKVEGHNFDIRKQLLEYDDVANEQRKVIYEQRNELLESEDISETLQAIRAEVVDQVIDEFVPPQSIEEQWDITGLEERLKAEFFIELPLAQWLKEDERLNERGLRERITAEVEQAYRNKVEEVGPEIMRRVEKSVMLQVLDGLWREHLAAMDYLRQGIHLRGYAQKNPKQEYKREAFEMFSLLLERLKYDTITLLQKLQIHEQSDVAAVDEQRRRARDIEYRHEQAPAAEAVAQEGVAATGTDGRPTEIDRPQTFVRNERKVGRNEPCPCGSGKKYKQCHGRLQ